MTRGGRAGATSLALVALLLAARCKGTLAPPAVHRPSDGPCTPGTPIAAVDGGACRTAADCPAGVNASCVLYADVGASFCNYDACDVDTQCGDGGVCVCADATGVTAGVSTNPRNLCAVGGNCRIDADCAPTPYCSPSSTGCGVAVDWYCHTQADACMSDSDCSAYDTCQYAPSAHRWSCVPFSSCFDDLASSP